MAQNVRNLCQIAPKPRTGRILGYVAQNHIPRAPSPPATPHFLWFPTLRLTQRDVYTPVPVVTWWSHRAARAAHSGGQRWVHHGPRGGKKDFFQSCSQTTWDAQKVFSAHFETMVTRFCLYEIPKCLGNGSFWDQKWFKNGWKMCFSKSDPGPFGMLKQVFLAHFEPLVTGFGPLTIPKSFQNELFWNPKLVKNGSKMCFSKCYSGPFGVHKEVNCAHFDPVWTQFSPLCHMYAPSCTLHTYLRAILWSHVELGRGV